MAKVRFDMVAESSTTTGTGTITLGGAKNPGRTFATAGVANGDTFKYRISHDVNNEWEVGTGTQVTSTTFSRSVIASSNANALVSFTAGNKTVELVVDKGDLDAMESGAGGLQTTLGTVTTGNFDAVVSAASDTVAGKIEVADQTEMEAASATNRAVTPGRQQFHPSACKCWGMTTGAGTPVLASPSFNTTSITDSGTGILTVTIGTDFSSANYSALASSTENAVTIPKIVSSRTKAAGTVLFDCDNDASTASDPTVGYNWAMFGDQ
jgi:hypothetical protein